MMMMDRGVLGSCKIWKEQLKKTVMVVAAVTAVCALIQAWINGYSSPLWFSIAHFNAPDMVGSLAPEPSTGSSSSAAAAIALQSYEGQYGINNLTLSNAASPNALPAEMLQNAASPITVLPAEMLQIDTNNQSARINETRSRNVSTFDWDFGNHTQQNYSYGGHSNSLDVLLGLSNVSNGNIHANKSVVGLTQHNNVTHGGNSINITVQQVSHNRTTEIHEETEYISESKIIKSSVHVQNHDWIQTLEQQLVLAKNDIMNASLILSDPELYSPLYHNLSRFKRSYERMEKTFKVFIYPDGEKPYVHEGPMDAIYASEGWFLKQMEENIQFVTKDYRKAHMFYMPYSVYEMRKGIPAPEHHNMPEMSLFIKNYVNMIASKYPFWNRTHGRDHFFVACHDWGPYITREHQELRSNAVKILCNADLSEGYFVAGKDGALPETNLHSLQQPPLGLGGFPARNRSILAFFAGGNHGRVRPVLFKYWKDKDPDFKVYENLPPAIAKKKSYIKHMKESKYCLCPMGYEVSSPRMVEAIYYDCIPVIIADNFFLPFSEVLNWEAFSITIAEKDIPNLKNTLLSITERRYFSMQSRLRKVRKHFLWHQNSPQRYDIFHMILHSVWTSRLNNIHT